MSKKRCRPQQYYTVDHKGQFWYGFRCHHIHASSYPTQDKVREAITKHLKKLKKS